MLSRLYSGEQRELSSERFSSFVEPGNFSSSNLGPGSFFSMKLEQNLIVNVSILWWARLSNTIATIAFIVAFSRDLGLSSQTKLYLFFYEDLRDLMVLARTLADSACIEHWDSWKKSLINPLIREYVKKAWNG